MIELYLFIAALAFLMLYFAVKKLTIKIDECEILSPIRAEIYPEFCDLIAQKIDDFKSQANDTLLKDGAKKDEYLELLSDLNRKLNFIKTMNLSKKDDALWQKELFGFLSNFENILIDFLKDGQNAADALRDELGREFARLKN